MCLTFRYNLQDKFVKIFNPEANGVVLAKHENTLMSSDQENPEFSEKRVLDPATEDPVARRAVRILHFKACPDTRLVSLSLENNKSLVANSELSDIVYTEITVRGKVGAWGYIPDRAPPALFLAQYMSNTFLSTHY